MTALRVLIVDDHDYVRSRCRALLEASGYAVIGEAHDAASAIAKAHRLSPDIVLLDVQLPDMDGFAVATELASATTAPRIVFISSRDASDYGSRLGRADRFIHKPDLSRATLTAAMTAPPE